MGWDSDSKQLPTLGSSLRDSKKENLIACVYVKKDLLCFDLAQKELEEQTKPPS